jgi:integrase
MAMKKLRKNEAAWLEKSGRWSIKVQRDGERKQFVSSTPGRKGKLEAERKADEWLKKGTVKELRFGEAYDNFIAAKKREAGTSWTTQLSTAGRLYLRPTLEHKKVNSITMQDWKDCILNAYERGLSRKTLANIRAAITNFHAYCEDAGVETAPLRKLKVPDDAPTGEKVILQPADLKTLFSCDTLKWRGQNSKCWYINAWRLMVVLGLRRGELCGLQRDDVCDGKLYIRRAVNCYGEITKGKTKAAQRCVVLPAHAQRILDDQAALLRVAGIISPWLFPNGNGEISDPNNLYKRWKSYANQHGIKSNLHELRHTHISLMQDEMPENLLKRTVGHTKSMDTFGVYGHEVNGEAEKAAQIIDSVFSTIIK